MKRLIFASMMLMSGIASAGGWSNLAVPTGIDVERGNGFMIYGDFGNAGACTTTNRIYIKIDHPQYNALYATALAAFAGKYKIQAYVQACESVGWYASPSVTFNIINSGSALNIAE